MKYILFFLFAISITTTFSQITLLKEATKKASGFLKVDQELTSSQVSEGLVEALIQGSRKSVNSASAKGGFNNNLLIRIPFPKKARTIKRTLLKIGKHHEIQQFEEKINSTAELASRKALNILINSVKSINIDDAFLILKGDDNAATEYLRKETYDDLYIEFKPLVDIAIAEAEVLKYWKSLVEIYNKLPLTKNISTDLAKYITTQTIEGLFILIAEEEKNIRKNPKARVSEILKNVFN